MKGFRRKGISNNVILVTTILNRKLRKLLTVVALIGLLWSYVPWNQINAVTQGDVSIDMIQEDPNQMTDYPTTTDPDFDQSQVEIDSEVEDGRTLSSKTFRKIDGTYEIAMYNDVIHYEDEGKLKNIDNSLTYDENTNEYENKENILKLKFPKKLDDNKSIKLSMDKYSIDWNVININESDITFDDTIINPSNIKELANINQSVLYSNVQSNVNIEYILTGSKIKENIILNSYTPDFSMTFEYKLKDLSLIENEEGNILFINEDNEVIFTFSSLFMMDNELNDSLDIEYTLIDTGNKTYEITITPSDEWLQDASYPVKIDPSILVNGSTTPGIRDKYAWATKALEYIDYLIVGKYGSLVYKSYIEVDTSSIPENAIVTYSHLQLRTYNNDSYNKCDIFSCQINLRQVNDTSDWSDIRNTSFNDVDSFIEDYEFVYPSDSGIEYYHWDITKIINDWEDDDRTLGIFELTKQTVLNDDRMYFASEGYSTTMGPNVTIGYQLTTGLYDFWTYHSIPMNDAGTAMISDFTGELSVVRNDYTGSHGGMVIDFGMFYSENLRETDIGYGNGWRTNFNSTVEDTGDEYVVTNPSGSQTHFEYMPCEQATDEPLIRDESLICYLADDGSRNILVEHDYDDDSTDEILIYTTNRIRYIYESNRLEKIEDVKTGYFLEISYSNDLISQITDYFGNYILMEYNNDILDYVFVELCQTWNNDVCISINLVEVIDYDYDSDGN